MVAEKFVSEASSSLVRPGGSPGEGLYPLPHKGPPPAIGHLGHTPRGYTSIGGGPWETPGQWFLEELCVQLAVTCVFVRGRVKTENSQR